MSGTQAHSTNTPARYRSDSELGRFWVVLCALALVPSVSVAEGHSPAAPDLRALVQEATQGARFPGRVVAANAVEVASTLDSAIEEIHFKAAQSVDAGDLLFTLDKTEFELAVRLAEANLAEVQANSLEAEQELARVNALLERGTATATQQQKAKARFSVSQARVLRAKASLEAAKIDLERTSIGAPISGQISAPTISVGSYVEAEAGSPLARIVQLDPVLVAYDEPYADQVDLLLRSGLERPEDFLGLFSVRLELAEDLIFETPAKPSRVSSTVDAATGTITVWAEFSNPKHILRPGMQVTVLPEVDLRVSP